MKQGGIQSGISPSLIMEGACPNMHFNTPAMPLTEAHFGGFFVPGDRQLVNTVSFWGGCKV